jgi:hypothetical protein
MAKKSKDSSQVFDFTIIAPGVEKLKLADGGRVAHTEAGAQVLYKPNRGKKYVSSIIPYNRILAITNEYVLVLSDKAEHDEFEGTVSKSEIPGFILVNDDDYEGGVLVNISYSESQGEPESDSSNKKKPTKKGKKEEEEEEEPKKGSKKSKKDEEEPARKSGKGKKGKKDEDGDW